MPIDATPDHVAIAVHEHDHALPRWRDRLGGGRWSSFHNPGGFKGIQLRYVNGAKLELLMPSPEDQDPDSFLRGFLGRFGPRVHHVTLKVPDLPAAIATLEDAGFDVMDVDLSGETWRESFLRPSQVGGIVVQVAWSAWSDEQWAAETGQDPEEPAGPGELLGPVLRHPDLDRAAAVWTALGAQVSRDDQGLTARWDGAPLEVRVLPGDRAEALGLRFRGVDPRPADPDLGPPVLPA